MTRLALIADVHANVVALEATIAALEARDVDAWVCAGDLVGYGPRPDECVERVAALGGDVVAGNHDLIAIGRLPSDECTAFAAESLRWTAGAIAPSTRARLEALPPATTVAQGAVVVAHGSLDDPREYVETPQAAEAQLDVLAARHPDARVLVLGHTHHPFAVARGAGVVAGPRPGSAGLPADGPLLVNPGSAGQPRGRDPRARAAVLDLTAGTVELLAVPWDVERVRADLLARGRPETSSWAPPAPLWRRARRRLLGR